VTIVISNIVFTKNRPLQLDAYLTSLYKYFPAELMQTYVLYKEELFGEEYRQLFSKYPTCIVVREGDFSGDFLDILRQVDTKYILFGIDDVVYFDAVDFDLIDKTFDENEDIFGFSLRFGQNVADNGRDEIHKIEVKGQSLYKVNWRQGQTPDTKYPFELCATVYRSELVKRIISSSRNYNPLIVKLFSPASPIMKGLGKLISTRRILKAFGYFYSPNTLESWNCRWCQNHKEILLSCLYFQKICASAIQVNMVNTSTNNTNCGSTDYTVEALAEKYKQGYRLDIEFIKRKKPQDIQCNEAFFQLSK